jgi:ATP-dependent exoDNAse (exonuclease V) beta subunit
VLEPATSGLPAEALGRLQRLAALWDEAQRQRWLLAPAAFMGWMLRQSGLAALPDPLAERALRKLLAIAHTYEAEHPADGLPEMAAYLERLLVDDPRAKAPELNSQADAVQVMTAHASKGLEFPVVIAADCRQKINPNRSSQPFHDPAAGLVIPDLKDESHPVVERQRRARNEARCLWYVTLTRAKRRLIITATNDSELSDGQYEAPNTLFEELWNLEAEAPTPGVRLALDEIEEPSPAVVTPATAPTADPSHSAQALQAQLKARLARWLATSELRSGS